MSPETPVLNLYVGWMAILAGLLMGIVFGAFFHDEKWLGGYGSWRRRMVRLGHVSFFGTGFLNLAFVFSVPHLLLDDGLRLPSLLFLAGAVTMPLVCFLSAWRDGLRYFFFVPVLSLITATALFLSLMLRA
jgi:hypothetical protein